MFVVRLKRPNEDFDVNAFESAKAALARFRTAQKMMIDGELEQCMLFDAVAAETGEDAVEMVRQGKARLIDSNLDSGAAPPAPERST